MKRKIDQGLVGFEESSSRVKRSIQEAKSAINPTRKFSMNKIIFSGISVAAFALLFVIIVTNNVQKNEPVTSDEQPLPIAPYEERKPNPITFNIFHYENIYNNFKLHTRKEAKLQAIYDIVDYYSLFYLAEDVGLATKKERFAFYEERGRNDLRGFLEMENYAQYYERLKQDLAITDEQFVTHYMVLIQEYNEQLPKLQMNGIQTELDDGQKERYAEKIYTALGFTNDDVKQLEKEVVDERMQRYELEISNPKVSFDYELLGLMIGQIENGDHIFLNMSGHFNYALFHYIMQFDQSVLDEMNEDVNRRNVEEHYNYFANYESPVPSKMKLAKEVAEILRILMNTLAWDDEKTPFH